MKERRNLMTMVVTTLAILTTLDETEALFSPPPPSTDSLTCLSDLNYCGSAFNTTTQPDMMCCFMLQSIYYSELSCLCSVISGSLVGFNAKDYMVQCSLITATTTLCTSVPSPTKSGPPTDLGEGSKSKSKSSFAVAVATAIPILVVVAAAVIVTVICISRRRNVGVQNIPGNAEFQGGPQLTSPFPKEQFQIGPSTGPRIFDSFVLQNATRNFSDENKLGEGGFGKVYMGILPSREVIAVKRLFEFSRQGLDELRNEVNLLARLQHNNLVQVLGYCIQDNEKMLCYEYLPNGSLDHFLFATDPTKRKVLDWSRRYSIIKGVGSGLQYLHVDSRLRIVHRDLKASNILLDGEMSPKISDFGISRLFDDNQTHLMATRIAGTPGYMAPEYLQNSIFSAKSDVYSFGILILEIVTGRRSVSNLINFVSDCWTAGDILQLKDPVLEQVSFEELRRCVHVGLLCVGEHPEHRPDMRSVNLMLSSASSELPDLQLASSTSRAFYGDTWH
ncbi:hypothetical protein LUZ60_015221 [Juncus effusus]|nr:hypothetical protein LUZ60_015221 [Juncus effusus]